MRMTMMKGHPLLQEIKVVEELAGPARFARIRERWPAEFQAQYDKGLLSAGWYPVTWLAELFATAMPLMPERPNLPELVGRAGVERDMKGVYRFLTKLVSPELLARHTARILSTYYRGPSIEQVLTEPRHHQYRLTNCAGFDRNVWRDLSGATQRIFEEVGARQVRVTYDFGGGDRDEASTLDVRWE